jgi:hypothetical protein
LGKISTFQKHNIFSVKVFTFFRQKVATMACLKIKMATKKCFSSFSSHQISKKKIEICQIFVLWSIIEVANKYRWMTFFNVSFCFYKPYLLYPSYG